MLDGRREMSAVCLGVISSTDSWAEAEAVGCESGMELGCNDADVGCERFEGASLGRKPSDTAMWLRSYSSSLISDAVVELRFEECRPRPEELPPECSMAMSSQDEGDRYIYRA
jgi:hypothetical protein